MGALLALRCDTSTLDDGACAASNEQKEHHLERHDLQTHNVYTRDARVIRTQLRREDGQAMTEYGVLLALIAVVVIVALLVLGPKIAAVFSNVAAQL